MVKRLLHSDTSLGSHTTRTRSVFFVLFLGLFVVNLNANAILLGQSKLIGYNKLTPERRDGVNASCEPDYNWANNDAGISPCVMAAAIEACETGPHTVPPLSIGSYYNPPSLETNTVNVCQCSWANYNLVSMCTVCQGQAVSLSPWASYTVECDGFTESNSYYPSNYEALLPSNNSIPLYAQTNPATQWTNGVFNVTQAQAVVNGTLSLQTSATSQSTSSKPIAAIIGASVGGTVVLLCFTGILFWVRRRNASKDEGRYQNLPNVGTPPSTRLSSSTPHSTINTRNDGSLRNSLYPSSISDYTGSLIHSEDSTRNSGVLTPFRKSYIDYPTAHDDGIYARPEDLAPIRRNTGPSVAPRSTQQMYDIIRNHQLGRYSEPVLPGSSGSGPAIYTYTILANNVAEETEEVPTDSSSPSARRTSNPPPYSPGGPAGEL
ncbi:hypothetical protein F5879DRAFT_992228 [Lentinula edodes]|uniref:uncharacterized protein n=1 Tax=Lentinula edodes TaxID=5353 RepID=UPI001E8CA597|nr:uncharacterized protein C8R40DRAFT_1166790 [Lentinula edodes]KAH7878806.1 hypothetical protein C8R40DRAFT_1166790 [Lentinula edodes]KAJ3901131.1 hypothetical protein F5879DRAFT_992228 [Lentinula edodes]